MLPEIQNIDMSMSSNQLKKTKRREICFAQFHIHVYENLSFLQIGIENSLKFGEFVKSRYVGLLSEDYVIDEVSFNLSTSTLVVPLSNASKLSRNYLGSLLFMHHLIFGLRWFS